MTTPDQNGTCVVGSFMMDLIAYAPRRPRPGETLVGTDFRKAPGGKGFNQAIASARSGAPTSMIGRVGTDAFGEEFLAELLRVGIHAQGITRDSNIGTGVGMPIVSADGQNSIIIIPRANHAVTPEQVRQHRNVIATARVLLLQLELPMDAVIEAARLAHDAGVRVVLNPAPFEPLPDELTELCDLIIPNEVELAAWGGVDTSEDVVAIATELSQRHGVDLIVTLGSRGVLTVPLGGEPTLIPAHVVEATDTIGAGDTFCGYVCALLGEGADLPTAARFANAAAAIAVTRPGGASAPLRNEVEDFLARTTTREDHS